jgi:hypothetical protein
MSTTMLGGLPLPLKLFLVLGGPLLTVLIAWMGIRQNSVRWFVGALIVAALWVALQGIDTFLVAKQENTIHERTSNLIAYLDTEIQRASVIEQKIRGDAAAEQAFIQYRDEIQAWRTRVGDELAKLLPESGASRIFLSALGETGKGPLYWEYSQLRACQTALIGILGASDGLVRRSRAITKT